MPKKLMDCVRSVMKSGKSKSDAFGICIKSTGLKPHKKKKAASEDVYPSQDAYPANIWVNPEEKNRGKIYREHGKRTDKAEADLRLLTAIQKVLQRMKETEPEKYGEMHLKDFVQQAARELKVDPRTIARVWTERYGQPSLSYGEPVATEEEKEEYREKSWRDRKVPIVHKRRSGNTTEEFIMMKKSFEVTEDDLLEPTTIVVDEDQVEDSVIVVEEGDIEERKQPIQVGGWTSASQFVKYCSTALRTAPEIRLTNMNSLRRAVAYYDNLENEIAEGAAADAEHAELSRQQLEVLDAVEETVSTVREHLKDAAGRTRRAKKFASKATLFTYYVDPFLFAVARIMVNAKVSSGKNIEDVFEKLASRYSIDDRETLALRQVLRDMGYPVYGSFVADDGAYDMITQYYA